MERTIYDGLGTLTNLINFKFLMREVLRFIMLITGRVSDFSTSMSLLTASLCLIDLS